MQWQLLLLVILAGAWAGHQLWQNIFISTTLKAVWFAIALLAVIEFVRENLA